MERARIEALVERGLTVAAIAAELDVSTTTTRYWLRKFALKTARASERRERRAAREAGIAAVRGHCPTHGDTDFRLNARRAYKCVLCAREAVSARRRRVKQILVSEAGGRCVRCGFAEHPAALQFHHVDPATKEFGLGATGVTRSLERARAEARKCILLCSNCHALVEAGAATV